MNIIVCTDENGGMLFNRRRQSMDRVVREDILKIAGDSRLWMNEYTFSQFSDPADNICVDEKFLEKAGRGEYCFVENVPVKPWEKAVEKLIVYCWNRVYPGDFSFDITPEDWELEEEKEFAGNSHERITRRIYKR